MNQNDIGSMLWVCDRTDYLCELYRRFASDLIKVREEQKQLRNQMQGYLFFDDVEAEVMYLIVRDLRPDVSCEISSGSGWSTSWTLRALRDNGFGILTSYDVVDTAKRNLPHDLTDGRWMFFQGDIHERLNDVPSKIDFLLMDSEHTDSFCDWFVPLFFPKVRNGGKIAIHDIFMIRTPAHGDAISLFRYLDQNGLLVYTPSMPYEETYSKIAAVRREIGIKDGDIVQNLGINSLCVLDIP
jgi:predicted O-methyltransferase YrrM